MVEQSVFRWTIFLSKTPVKNVDYTTIFTFNFLTNRERKNIRICQKNAKKA